MFHDYDAPPRHARRGSETFSLGAIVLAAGAIVIVALGALIGLLLD